MTAPTGTALPLSVLAQRFVAELIVATDMSYQDPEAVTAEVRELLATPDFKGVDRDALREAAFRLLEERCMLLRLPVLVTLGQPTAQGRRRRK